MMPKKLIKIGFRSILISLWIKKGLDLWPSLPNHVKVSLKVMAIPIFVIPCLYFHDKMIHNPGYIEKFTPPSVFMLIMASQLPKLMEYEILYISNRLWFFHEIKKFLCYFSRTSFSEVIIFSRDNLDSVIFPFLGLAWISVIYDIAPPYRQLCNVILTCLSLRVYSYCQSS